MFCRREKEIHMNYETPEHRITKATEERGSGGRVLQQSTPPRKITSGAGTRMVQEADPPKTIKKEEK